MLLSNNSVDTTAAMMFQLELQKKMSNVPSTIDKGGLEGNQTIPIVVGFELLNRYTLLSTLGYGATATVLQAVDFETGQL